MDPNEAAQLYLKRITTKIPVFETMEEKELNYVKMINAGQSFFYNNVSFNYISHRIVFYLTNLHVKSRATFFVRAGTATEIGFVWSLASSPPNGTTPGVTPVVIDSPIMSCARAIRE